VDRKPTFDYGFGIVGQWGQPGIAQKESSFKWALGEV
jgi:hypothetical protein